MGMVNGVPDKVVAVMDKIIARAATNPRLGQLVLNSPRTGYKLRIIFDGRKLLRPVPSRARGMFLSYRKNEDNRKESIIWLFFSKNKLLNNPKCRSVLVHELIHFFDFDVDMKFSRHYQNYWWNKLAELVESKQYDKLHIARRDGRHEARARKIQAQYLKAEVSA